MRFKAIAIVLIALSSIIKAQARAGRTADALNTDALKTKETTGKSDPNGALFVIAVTQARAGQIAEAQKSAEAIGGPEREDFLTAALVYVAKAQARAGQTAGALSTLKPTFPRWPVDPAPWRKGSVA